MKVAVGHERLLHVPPRVPRVSALHAANRKVLDVQAVDGLQLQLETQREWHLAGGGLIAISARVREVEAVKQRVTAGFQQLSVPKVSVNGTPPPNRKLHLWARLPPSLW